MRELARARRAGVNCFGCEARVGVRLPSSSTPVTAAPASPYRAPPSPLPRPRLRPARSRSSTRSIPRPRRVAGLHPHVTPGLVLPALAPRNDCSAPESSLSESIRAGRESRAGSIRRGRIMDMRLICTAAPGTLGEIQQYFCRSSQGF